MCIRDSDEAEAVAAGVIRAGRIEAEQPVEEEKPAAFVSIGRSTRFAERAPEPRAGADRVAGDAKRRRTSGAVGTRTTVLGVFKMHRSSRVRLAVGATAVALGLLAAGCASSTTGSSASGPDTNDTISRANKGVVESAEKPKLGGKLVYALNSETNGWNPATNQWAPPGLIVSRAIFDTLTAYDDQSHVKPFLAESFSSNADFTKWTFKLRPGIKLQNGKPANADVVVRNQTYLSKSPITGPAYKYSGVTAITKEDDLTFSVTLSRGSAVYPIALATQLGVVADPDWLESNDSLKPIGTGPFAMDTWQIGNKLTVKKNPDYWRKDANGVAMPYLDSVEFRIVTDNDARCKPRMSMSSRRSLVSRWWTSSRRRRAACRSFPMPRARAGRTW